MAGSAFRARIPLEEWLHTLIHARACSQATNIENEPFCKTEIDSVQLRKFSEDVKAYAEYQ
jgi:hypothetical protein